MAAVFSLKGQEFMCIDSNIKHEFSFTPSFSIYVTCESEAEFDHLYQKSSDVGEPLCRLGTMVSVRNLVG
jgi:predicted 3-demethylubiquinone-9 3-methyltransferase (glyoxalase superfamily)